MADGEPPALSASARPSHIELCTEFIERKNMMDNNLFEFSQFTVQEDEAVCMDWSAPHARMMQIFSSGLIAHVGGPFKLSYEHNCQRTTSDLEEKLQERASRTSGSNEAEIDFSSLTNDLDEDEDITSGNFDMTTLQQIYPVSGLIIDDISDEMAPVNIELMAELCRGCINSYDQSTEPFSTRGTKHCILYPGSFPEREDGRIVPLAAIIETVQDRMRQASAEWITTPGVRPFNKESESGAFIYLSGQSSGMPLYQYTKHIPNSITSIQIMGSVECAKSTMNDGSSCVDHGRALKEYLARTYPQATVRFDLTPSTATAMSRMVTSKYLICGPGTVECLLPALSGEVGTYAVLSESNDRLNTEHWFDSLMPYSDSNIIINNLQGAAFNGDATSQQEVVGNIGSVGPDGQQIDQQVRDDGTIVTTITNNPNTDSLVGNKPPPNVDVVNKPPVTGTGDFSTTSVSGGGAFISDSTFPSGSFSGSFGSGTTTTTTTTGTSWNTASPPDRSDGCTELRGNLGSWEASSWDKDFDYDALKENAEELIGRSDLGDLNFMTGKQAGGGGGLSWKETAYPNCDLDMLNLEGLCQVVAAMGLERLYFVGDNLMSEQVASFWKMVGANVNEPYSPDPDGNWRKTVTCPNQSGKKFEIVFTRNDRLVYGDDYASQLLQQGGFGAQQSMMNYLKGSMSNPCACNSWMNDYMSNPGRTFVVAGAGANSPGYPAFQNDFNAFMAGVQAANRPQDFVAYRTSPTQGYGCCACQASFNLAAGPGFRALTDDEKLIKLDMSPEDITKANSYVTSAIHDHNLSRRAEEHKRYFSPKERRATVHDSFPTLKILNVERMMDLHPHSGESGRKLQCGDGGMGHNPHDSWNNMLYSMMLDMVNNQQMQPQPGMGGFP